MTTLEEIIDRLSKIEKHLNITNNFSNIETKFKKFIIDTYSFERMIHSGTKVNFPNYSEFVKWNIKCINELSPEKQAWLFNLCQQINNKEINMMDEESCAIFTASKIFFNEEKTLCIMNPR